MSHILPSRKSAYVRGGDAATVTPAFSYGGRFSVLADDWHEDGKHTLPREHLAPPCPMVPRYAFVGARDMGGRLEFVSFGIINLREISRTYQEVNGPLERGFYYRLCNPFHGLMADMVFNHHCLCMLMAREQYVLYATRQAGYLPSLLVYTRNILTKCRICNVR